MRNCAYIMLCICLLACCRNSEPPVERLTILPQEICCEHTGGEFEIAVECSSDWNLQDTLDWVEAVRLDDVSALVIISGNDSYSRSGKVRVSTGKIDAELSIEQTASNNFSIDCKTQDISYLGDTFTVSVTSYLPWTVMSENSWISTDINSSEGPEKVTVKAEANDQPEDREGKVFFIQERDTLSVTVSQSALPFIKTARDSVSIDGDGGRSDLLFLSNSSVVVTSEEEWIQITEVTPGNIIYFEVSRNTGEAREGNIKISIESDENIFRTVKVIQGEKVLHPVLRFEEGDQMSVTDSCSFQLHPIFEEMTDNQLIWSSSNPDIAGVDQSGNIRIHKTGQCTVTADNRFHDVQASILLDIKLQAQQISVMFGNQDVIAVPVSSRFAGEKIPVIVTVTPSESYSDDFTFFSSNSEVAEFVNNTLHCLQKGKTDIYIESAFNNWKYTFTVYVIEM